MNRNCLSGVLLVFLLSELAWAGDPAPSRPSPPLVKSAPDNASWTVKFEVEQKPGGAEGRELQQIEVAKTGEIRRDLFLYSDGSRTENWRYAGFDFVQSPQGHISMLDPSVNDAAPNFGGYSDFPGFRWVSIAFFVDRVRIGDRLYDHYRYESSHASVSASELVSLATAPGAEAWIDSETKLPAFLLVRGVRQSYAFGPAPGAALKLPPLFEAEYEAFMAPAREAEKYKMRP